MSLVSSREREVSMRALELLQDIARAMQETKGRTLLGDPKLACRATFRPDVQTYGETATPSYSGQFHLEVMGRGVRTYFPRGSDERRLFLKGHRTIASLRLNPPLETHVEEGGVVSHMEMVMSTMATCTIIAPRLIPSTFREDVRRFMRDYFEGQDRVRFFTVSYRRGILTIPWVPGGSK